MAASGKWLLASSLELDAIIVVCSEGIILLYAAERACYIVMFRNKGSWLVAIKKTTGMLKLLRSAG